MTYFEILRRFEFIELEDEETCKCKCPIHSNQELSLLVRNDKEHNKTIISCENGCKLQSILYAVHLEEKDLSVVPEEEALEKFHFFNKNNKASSVYDYQVFKDIEERGELFILSGVPYIYKDGVFIADLSGAYLKTEISERIYPELIKSSTIDRIYKLFFAEKSLQISFEDVNAYPDHWINFKNGFYDPIKKKIVPHNPKYRAINQIPHNYNPKEELSGEQIEKWLQFIAPDPEDKEMLLQYIGYCLTKDTSQQKFLILYGSGGSGKSTVINLIEAIIGSKNISNISLKDLSQRFASYCLLGKLLNSCADLEVSALEDTSVIKKLLGEDCLQGEAKGKDSVSFKNYAKLIFSTNELPLILSEKTNGFYRRLLILKMSATPETIIPNFLEVLKAEIDYFIMLSVKALERMYETGRIGASKHSLIAVQTLREDSDSVEAWINDKCLRDISAREERGTLYQNYESFCHDNDRTPLTRHAFYRNLRIKGFGEHRTSFGRFFCGIYLTEEKTDFTPVSDLSEVPF